MFEEWIRSNNFVHKHTLTTTTTLECITSLITLTLSGRYVDLYKTKGTSSLTQETYFQQIPT